MDPQTDERYRDETRRLVDRRGPLGGASFAIGVGSAGLLEAHYHPERLFHVVLFFALELAICLVAAGAHRVMGHRFAIGIVRLAGIALLLCVGLYGALTGASPATLAFLFIVFELTTALMFPWGARDQLPLAVASVLIYAACVGRGVHQGGGETLPLAYELYAVVAGAVVSVLGSLSLDRQRFTVFVQREQLDRQVTMFHDLARAFDGFDPQRVILLTCASTLEAFRLRRLWAVWQAPDDRVVQGYLSRRTGDAVTLEPIEYAGRVWDVVGKRGSGGAFLARGEELPIPGSPPPVAVLCIPLEFEGERLGVLCADRNGEPFQVGERELSLASVLASGAAIAMANARLYQQVADASAEKSAFLARIAHELRNPVHTLLWDIDALRSEAARARPELERMRHEALMILDLAKQLREVAEVETRQLTASCEPVSMAQLFDDLQATAAALLAGRPITFSARVASGADVVHSDPLRLRQILGNLLSNAAKFTAGGAIELAARRTGSEIEISVRDTGVGIEHAELGAIFRPFSRGSGSARTRAQGMGLGLAIAHEITTLLGGRIEVESAVDVGSTFRLLLPALVLEHEEAAADAPALPPPAAPLPAVVLLIEDDVVCRRQTADVLRRSGARVIEAGDGFEGLRRAREQRPDLIVLDMGLPRLSGSDVLASLQRDSRLADVPVVVATAEAEPPGAGGCAGYLMKPYAAEELLRIVAAAARREEPGLGAAG